MGNILKMKQYEALFGGALPMKLMIEETLLRGG